MTKSYAKPIVLVNTGLAEGIYAASGDEDGWGQDCYTCNAYINQKPETGRDTYVIQVNASHAADHHSGQQRLHITFNQPVTYVSCGAKGATLKGGDGTSTLIIGLTYHNNQTDNIGFGDLTVKSEAGLNVEGCVLYCNRDCGQH